VITEDEFILLRSVTLPDEMQAKLWPFLNAYRSHDEVETWKDLRENGLEPVEKQSVVAELERVVGANQWRSWMTLSQESLN
jgi:hypothetical protein